MFDPPHLGHVILASEAAWQLGLEEVRLVVCARPPHREQGWLSPELRLNLVECAIAGQSKLVASRVELDRAGPSYTVDTLEHFATEDPGAALWLIVGADQLRSFAQWRAPERIVEIARLAVAARDGADRDDLQAVADQVAPGRVDWVEMPMVEVSSSMIRERIEDGVPVRHLVGPAVDDILVSEGLSNGPSTLP